MSSALEAWDEALRSWAIPREILLRAPESPWTFPVELFRRRADQAVSGELSPGHRRALKALPIAGSVLDVGCGAGAASLPLCSRASLVVGVDSSPAMLEEFREGAGLAGARVEVVEGLWPDVAEGVAPADVVVCQHVLYNVPDLEPFARELDRHARRRVVMVITERHPLSWMNDLWVTFHRLERPDRPTAGDAVAALGELGLEVHREDHVVTADAGGFGRREDAVAFVRRRLCLTSGRDEEVAAALGDRLVHRRGAWTTGPTERAVTTVWWDR